MPICPDCKMVGGYHRGWCGHAQPRPVGHTNLIRYPSPNRLGLVQR